MVKRVRHARALPVVKTDFPLEAPKDTEPIAKIQPVSEHTCARVNAMIDRRWSSIRLYVKVDGIPSYAEVVEMKPSYDRPGFVMCKLNTVIGERYAEIGAGHSFDLRLQIR